MKTLKRLLSILLCSITILSALTVGCAGAEILSTNSSAENENIIEFGCYPQTMVTDKSLIATLNGLAGDNKKWTSYKYYAKSVASDFMRYKDVTYGSDRYRAVIFDTFRPIWTRDETSTYEPHCAQSTNGFACGNIYWFKYEPVKWRVLDKSTGLVMCDTLIDSQPYSNYKDSLGLNDSGIDASDWKTSSLRAWLNNDFYNTAFTTSEKENIKPRTIKYRIDNVESPDVKSPDIIVTDNVSILTSDESVNSKYGFSTNIEDADVARQALGSDYAKCQGLDIIDKITSSEYCGFPYHWWICNNSYGAGVISGVGHNTWDMTNHDITDCGVRPVLNINSTNESNEKISIFKKIVNFVTKLFGSIVDFFENLFN